jgi:nitronate monooxygenase
MKRLVRNLDWPALYTGRALQNAFSRQWHGREAELEKSLRTEAPRYARAAEANDLDTQWSSPANASISFAM